MDQPALAASTPAPFLRRAFDWWLAQVKHVLPPTIFFFVGFNLILWTKRLILEEHGVEFRGLFTATSLSTSRHTSSICSSATANSIAYSSDGARSQHR